MPSTWTASPSGTVISMPPITATAMISDSAWAKVERVRSSSMPPNIANAVSWAGTTHSPLRVAPPKIATTDDEDESTPAGGCQPDAGAGAGIGGHGNGHPGQRGQRRRDSRRREPVEDGDEVGRRSRAEGRGQPLLVLVAVQPTLGIGVADDVGHPGAVGVGDQDPTGRPERALGGLGGISDRLTAPRPRPAAGG